MEIEAKKNLRIGIILFSFCLLFFIYFFKAIDNVIHYSVISLLIIHGIKVVVDFFFNIPMKVGYAKELKPDSKNKFYRIFGLVLGMMLITFGSWWIFVKL